MWCLDILVVWWFDRSSGSWAVIVFRSVLWIGVIRQDLVFCSGCQCRSFLEHWTGNNRRRGSTWGEPSSGPRMEVGVYNGRLQNSTFYCLIALKDEKMRMGEGSNSWGLMIFLDRSCSAPRLMPLLWAAVQMSFDRQRCMEAFYIIGCVLTLICCIIRSIYALWLLRTLLNWYSSVSWEI